MQNTLDAKLEELKHNLRQMKAALIAFSGGTDSTFLVKVAHDVLHENAVAVTLASSAYPQRELNDAKRLAKELGISHIIIESEYTEIPSFRKNAKDRCYHCKKEQFAILKDIAEKNSIVHVLDATNHDDRKDYRPGMLALKELGITSPLKDAKLTKKEIRHLSKDMGIDTWDKPSQACLASRIAYGTEITKERLERIERAEDIIKDLGIKQLRIRYHDTLARIEVSRKDMPLLLKHSKEITRHLKGLGFIYITLDLEGYRTGSLNEVLENGTYPKRL